MEPIDIWWDIEPRFGLYELREKLKSVSAAGLKADGRHDQLIELLQQENEELRLRLGILTRLLIQQGTVSAEQLTASLAEARANIDKAKLEASRVRAVQNKKALKSGR